MEKKRGQKKKNAASAQGWQEKKKEEEKKEEKESDGREEEKKESENEGRKKKKDKGRKKEKAESERNGKEKGRAKKEKKTNARNDAKFGRQIRQQAYEQACSVQEPIEMSEENPTFNFLSKLRNYLFRLESGFDRLDVEKKRAFSFVRKIRKALKLRDKEKRIWSFSKRMELKRKEIEKQTKREEREKSEALMQERLMSASAAAASAAASAATVAALAVSAEGNENLGAPSATPREASNDGALMDESEKMDVKELGSPESDATLYALPSPYEMPKMLPFDYEEKIPPQDEEGKPEKVQIWSVEGSNFTPSNSSYYSFYGSGDSIADSWTAM